MRKLRRKKQIKKNPRKNKKQTKLEQLEAEREAKRVALERYLLYYTKYLEYDAKVKSSPQVREKSQNRIKTFHSETTTLAEVKFIETGTETLLDSQTVLKYSYVYSYYLADNTSEKDLFLFLQLELEKTAIALAQLLEEQNILKRRTEIVDLTKLVQKRKDNIIQQVHGLV